MTEECTRGMNPSGRIIKEDEQYIIMHTSLCYCVEIFLVELVGFQKFAILSDSYTPNGFEL